MHRPAIVALMGPTASGKTAASIELAERFGGEIVSVDSALVYRGLDVGSAKPTPAERRGIPHHLIDVREPHEPYSAADFATEARATIDQIHQRGSLPVLVGGTGLYFTALLDGLSDMPAADPEIRAGIAEEAAESGWPALHARLATVDPSAAARIKPTDPQRITRALEVFRLTGRPISAWQGDRRTSGRLHGRVLRVILCPVDRAELHQRIAVRFGRMIESGLIDEVAMLRRHPLLHPGLPAIRAVGYRQVWEYLDGALRRDQLEQRVVAATRQLAKRQITWLRREWGGFWRDPGDPNSDLHNLVTRFLA